MPLGIAAFVARLIIPVACHRRDGKRAARRRECSRSIMTVVIWLFVAFIVLPVAEIWLITQVAGELGWVPTLLLVIAVSAAGAFLVRREGIGVISRVRGSLEGGRIPTNDLADGAMIFFASALMLTPGFLTDGVGLALLIPPIRAVLRPPIVAFFKRKVDVRVAGLGGARSGGPFGSFGPFENPRRRDAFDVDGDIVSDQTPGPDDQSDFPELD